MLYFIIIAAAALADQFTKYLASAYLKAIGTFPIIEGVFHLTYAENTGAAFSFMRGRQIFLIITTFLIIVFALGYLYKSIRGELGYPAAFNIALAFVIGGAIGNLADRMRLGYVVDMFDFRLIDFAIFNVADSFICVGMAVVAFFIIKIGG